MIPIVVKDYDYSKILAVWYRTIPNLVFLMNVQDK